MLRVVLAFTIALLMIFVVSLPVIDVISGLSAKTRDKTAHTNETEIATTAEEIGQASVADRHALYYLKQAKNNLRYFQDKKTGICFAFTWASDSSFVIGGPATVECEKIPSNLLNLK